MSSEPEETIRRTTHFALGLVFGAFLYSYGFSVTTVAVVGLAAIALEFAYRVATLCWTAWRHPADL